MTITVSISGVDTSGIQWLRASSYAKDGIYVYQSLKGASKGKIWGQGTESDTYAIYGRCAYTSANMVTIKSMVGKTATISGSMMPSTSVYITGVSQGTYNPVWLYVNVSVTEV